MCLDSDIIKNLDKMNLGACRLKRVRAISGWVVFIGCQSIAEESEVFVASDSGFTYGDSGCATLRAWQSLISTVL